MKQIGVLFFAALCAAIPIARAASSSQEIVKAARAQIGVTTMYDPAYVSLRYPGGDVPRERGVCTDVVIRALRDALGIDLQQTVHEDMGSHFSAYPKNWGLSQPDKNIDHRRVPNLQTYFKRHELSLAFPANENSLYQAGDLVTSRLPGNLPHIMIISDHVSSSGVPLVIHNIGNGTQEEDRLFSYPLTGHFRLKSRSNSTAP